MNRRLSTPRCLDCGVPRQTCEASRDIERRPCCDRCDHGDLAEPDTSRLKGKS